MLSWVKKLSGDEPEDPNKPQHPPANASDQQPSEKPPAAADQKKEEEERLKKEEEDKKAAAASPAAPAPSADEIRRKRLERFGGNIKIGLLEYLLTTGIFPDATVIVL
jgi:hypothetical protein